MPFVIIDRAVENKDTDMVLLDNVSAAYELTSHLIQNGYKKLAGLFGDASATGQERSRGFHRALKDAQLTPVAAHFISPRIKQGFDTTIALLESNNRPDAIFTSNSLLTAGAFQALRAKKVLIPNEVAIVGFDETTWGELVDPPITVISQPTEEIGRTATELLFQRIQEPTRLPKTVILNGNLLVKESSRRR